MPFHPARLVVLVTVAALGSTLVGAPAAVAAPITEPVLVVLRGPAGPPSASAERARAAVVRGLAARGNRPAAAVHRYALVNAFSTEVTAGELSALRADPAVGAVVRDQATRRRAAPAPAPASTSDPARPEIAAAGYPVAAGTCPVQPSAPLLEPEALTLTRAASNDPAQPTAAQLTDGTGTRVGFLADTAPDPASPDLRRADGSAVVVETRAFPAGAPVVVGATGSAVASAIGAQARVVHDLADVVYRVYPLPTGCTVRVRGMAPGADLVALQTDGSLLATVAAIDHAVTTADVDVLHEPSLDELATDPAARAAISAFDASAVAAGVTVVRGSEAATTDGVVAVASSTAARAYGQTGGAGVRRFGNGLWASDQLSSSSVNGPRRPGAAVDLVAPGEAGWAVCSPSISTCTDFDGEPSDLQLASGTGQAAAVTAGAAALVVAAYRSTHSGASPGPARVEQLLSSTARDLGLSPADQGAGRLDARSAVEAAATFPGASGVPAGIASNVVVSRPRVEVTGPAGAPRVARMSVRNVGTAPVEVRTGTRDFAPVVSTSNEIYLSTASEEDWPFADGRVAVYARLAVTVPAGTDRWTVRLDRGSGSGAGRGTPVSAGLFDPDGRLVNDVVPTSADAADVQVRDPAAGDWTVLAYTPTVGGYSGPLVVTTTAEREVRTGVVTPRAFTLQPGQSRQVAARVVVPVGGEQVSALTVTSTGGRRTAVAVVRRVR